MIYCKNWLNIHYKKGAVYMMTILYMFFLLFFIFYGLNYIGQKLIAKEYPMNHGVIVTLSAVEGILVFVIVGVNAKFPFLFTVFMSVNI